MAPAPRPDPDNQVLAANLREYADILEQQDADGFRVAAYRRAAGVVEQLSRPVREVLRQEGRDGLIALPVIGRAIASALAEMVATGHWSQLERVRGTLDPETLLRTVPGIGPELAARIHDELHVETLEALETATVDGSLDRLPGFGPRRTEMVRAALADRLGRPRLRRQRQMQARPPVDILLEIDRVYRERATAGSLRRIAPKRFNPSGEAWLPILHASRDGWDLTALYSNTALAHELGRTHDWVVIYYHTDSSPEGQCTVVTETHGALKGRRVVRGREAETPAASDATEISPR